jgi:hypothetical protein
MQADDRKETVEIADVESLRPVYKVLKLMIGPARDAGGTGTSYAAGEGGFGCCGADFAGV